MPMTLTIVAEDADQMVSEFQRLNALTTSAPTSPNILDQTPLDVVIEQVRQRLKEQGFKLEVVEDQRQQSDPVVEPPTAIAESPEAPEPAPSKPPSKPKKAAKPNGVNATNEAPAPPDDDELPGPRRSKAPPAEILTEPSEPDPEGDRQVVMDTLAGVMRDPKRKDKVLAFAKANAQLHGKTMLSDLPAGAFPPIRVAMEKEFPMPFFPPEAYSNTPLTRRMNQLALESGVTEYGRGGAAYVHTRKVAQVASEARAWEEQNLPDEIPIADVDSLHEGEHSSLDQKSG